MKNLIPTLAGIIVAAVVAGNLIHWMDARDAAIMNAGDAYTACVQATYHMNPAGYYQIHGVYPSCP